MTVLFLKLKMSLKLWKWALKKEGTMPFDEQKV